MNAGAVDRRQTSPAVPPSEVRRGESTPRRPVIIFYFGADLKRLLAVVTEIRAAGRRASVIDASYSGELERDYAYIGARHISDWWDSPGVQGARDLAADWMQRVPQHPLTISGSSILDTFSSDGAPLWWLFEISLQERAYLAVRLVEAVRAAISAEPASHYIVVDEHPTHAWKSGIVARSCREAGLLPLLMPPGLASGPLPPVDGQPASRAGRWRDMQPAPSSWWLGSRIARKIVAVLVAGFGVMVGTVFAIVALPVVITLWAVRWLLTLGRPGVGLARSYLTLLSSPARIGPARVDLLIAIDATALAALAVLSWPRWQVPLLVAVGVAVAAGAINALMVAFAPAGLAVGEQLSWPARMVRKVFSQRRQLVREALIRLRRRRAAGSKTGASRPVLVLIDEGNVRKRHDLTRRRRGEYVPYLEGVIEALNAQNEQVVVVSYGDPRRATAGIAGRMQRLGSLMGRRKRIPLRAGLDEARVRRADQLRTRREAEWGILAGDPGLQAAFEYKGIDCWPAFASDFGTLFADSPYSEAYQAAFGEILDTVRPAVVVTYNYEGVFRRLLPALVRRGIATLGVQQALGPYVHALKHDVAGYDRPLHRQPGGVPTPDRIAVWGERDIEYLRSYGFDAESLLVAGYPRSDPYLRESGRIDKQAVLHRLGIRDPAARLVAYTAVRRVLGTGLMREDHWLETLRRLIDLTESDHGLWVMVKPWPGDDMDWIRRALDRLGNDRVVFVDPDVEVHNVELLSVVQVVVGTFSSLFSEAILSGAVPVLLDYPETRYYFGAEVGRYAAISLRAESPTEAIAQVRRVLAEPGFGARFIEGAVPALRPLFGPLDGNSAERVAAAVGRMSGRSEVGRWPAGEAAPAVLDRARR